VLVAVTPPPPCRPLTMKTASSSTRNKSPSPASPAPPPAIGCFFPAPTSKPEACPRDASGRYTTAARPSRRAKIPWVAAAYPRRDDPLVIIRRRPRSRRAPTATGSRGAYVGGDDVVGCRRGPARATPAGSCGSVGRNSSPARQPVRIRPDARVASDASAATVALCRTVRARLARCGNPPSASSDGITLGRDRVRGEGRRPLRSLCGARLAPRRWRCFSGGVPVEQLGVLACHIADQGVVARRAARATGAASSASAMISSL